MLSSIGVIESFTISKGWQGPSKTGMSYLKDDWIPGDLGFDPLSLNPDKKTGFVSTYNEMSDEFKVRKRGTHTHTHKPLKTHNPPFPNTMANDASKQVMRTKELNNGRLAMISVAGMVRR